MKKTPRFLICNNPLVDQANQFILCTRSPKALFEVVKGDSGHFNIYLQDLYSGTEKELETALTQSRQWYIAFLAGDKSNQED